jgi:hypothetical protein
MSSKDKYLVFTERYKKPVKEFEIAIEISPASALIGDTTSAAMTVKAIWDTGATCTVINPSVQKNLNLCAVRRAIAKGVNSIEYADVVPIDINLPNGFIVRNILALVADINSGGSDVLIGMDIITQGDSAISSTGGETVFSFVMPPLKEGINLHELAAEANRKSNEN